MKISCRRLGGDCKTHVPRLLGQGAVSVARPSCSVLRVDSTCDSIVLLEYTFCTICYLLFFECESEPNELFFMFAEFIEMHARVEIVSFVSTV